jgi:RHS repeat-associated protein
LSSAGASTYTFFPDGLIKSRADDFAATIPLGGGTTTFTLASTSNRLQAATGLINRSYSYDAAGNTLGDGTRSFTYDDAGRMKTSTSAGVTTTYRYNGLGERVKKSSSAATVYFAYDEAGHLIGEYDSSGALIEETVWFGDIPVATLRPSGGSAVHIYYVHTDHLNTPRRVTDSTDNTIVWRWDSEPYGSTPANDDPDADTTAFTYNLRFPGQYFDAETGLYYNDFRDYDAVAGKYVESDPLGLGGGISTYAYVGGNPIQFFDQLGLMLCGDWGWMAIDWALGLGSKNRTFGESTDQAIAVSHLPPIETARTLYKQKNGAEQSSSCCDVSKLQAVTDVAAKFGLSGFIHATLMGSCAWHYIGSFDINVYPISCKRARFVVKNNSSFRSFMYGVGPSWSSGPMSNLFQTYTWEEDL